MVCRIHRAMQLLVAGGLAVGVQLLDPAFGAENIEGDLAFAKGEYSVAFSEWSAAAAAGDTSAMSSIGTLYDTGHGVPQDFTQALSWYLKAAEAGNTSAMFNAAVMFDNGRGTHIDRLEAIRWYGLAAQRGSGRAAYDLGVIYRDGDGVPRDKSLATHYFYIALASGIEAARPNLVALGANIVSKPLVSPRTLTPTESLPRTNGSSAEISHFQKVALERGELGTLSPKVVTALIPALSQEALNNNEIAQYDLGFLSEHGLGTPVDLVKSYVYYLKAATSHNSSVDAVALRGAAEVAMRLSPEQHAAARNALLGGF